MAKLWAKFKELAGIEEIEADSEPEEEKNPYVERRTVDMR